MEILLFLVIFTLVFAVSGIATYRYCRNKAAYRNKADAYPEDGDDNGH